MNNEQRKAFLDCCNTIKHVEQDKDLFLKASRLERHESRLEPLKVSDIMKITCLICGTVIVCALLYLANLSGSFQFGIAIGIVGFITFIPMGIKQRRYGRYMGRFEYQGEKYALYDTDLKALKKKMAETI